jgi:predicted MPP superfamily phosphohydrolase
MSPRRPLKGIVDFTDHFQRIPILFLGGAAVLLSVVVGAVWNNGWVGAAYGVFVCADGALLILLPRLKRSFGAPQLPWLSLMVIRLVPTLAVAALPSGWTIGGLAGFHLVVAVSAWYACWVEPMCLNVVHIPVRSEKLNGCSALRVLQISDLHIERITERERRLLNLVEQLTPDAIVLTGDYLNISYTHDPDTKRQARELLAKLDAPYGVFAVTGSPSVDPPTVLAELLDGLDIIWLRDRVLQLDACERRLQIVGVECSYDILADEERLHRLLDDQQEDVFKLLLYHTPDVMPAAVKAKVDLYLAGHTHGGQLRLPLYGAIVTASNFGKRYEMGLYREEDTTLYVSRGVGLEGAGAPRARFLSPPEITLFTLSGCQD